MCGIAAIIHSETEVPANSSLLQNHLKSMLDQIEHRGDPENHGETLFFDGTGLGTNRLAIVDREQGRQPKCDNGRRYWVILNGEIYNYKRLRAKLERKNYRFESQTDTEVIACGYREWGEKLVALLDGEFAFVIYDRESREFFAARDHMGIKPLYYSKNADGTFYFASEQKAILQFSSNISVLPPGHFINQDGVQKYFSLPSGELDLSSGEIVRHFKSLFVKAVEKRLDTDLPVAVMFSGGIDSTAVLHVAKEFHKNITAITIGFPGAEDVSIAKRYCREFNIRHEVVELKRDEVIGIIPHIVRGAEFFESIDVMDTCIGYFGYKHAQKLGFKVALCGEGSDELLAGYDLFLSHHNPVELMKYRVGNLYRTDVQRVDRSSMLNRIEARVPFLDKEFLEYSYRIPMSYKLRNGVAKWVLREAFRGDLPPLYVDRKKARMPDGTGLHNLLYDYAGVQDYSLDSDLMKNLSLVTNQQRFFMSLYLRAGFPAPLERFKKPVFDYSENGYFNFITPREEIKSEAI